MAAAISKHNSKILRGGRTDPPPCECEEENCPVEGNCKTSGVVYQATLSFQGDKVEKYVGLTERRFISRFKEHQRNFEDRNPKNSTTLSRKIWNLKDRGVNYEVKWKILQKSKPYLAGMKECRLCLTEIFFILFHPEEATLNSRSEIMNKCRHSNKFKLSKN